MSDLIDQSNIFKVYAGSVEVSPFHQCYVNDNTVLRNCAGRLFPHYNGEDVVACYWALRKKAVLFDVPERPVEVSGKDAVSFLNLIFTREISTLQPNRGLYSLACNHNGGLFMDVVIFRLALDRFWIVQPDGDMTTWLRAHRAGFEVDIIDPKSRVLQIQGPKSFDVMSRASDGFIDKKFGYFHSGFVSLGGQELYVSRTGWTGELGYEIYTQGEQTNAVQLWDHLMQSCPWGDLQFSSMQAMNIRRIEAGILDSGSDFNHEMNPFEAGLDRFIDMRKGQFIGRKSLLTASRKKKLYGVLSTRFGPKQGDVIMDNTGVIIGRVTTGVQSPQLSAWIGYVNCHDGGDYTNKKMMLKNQRGEEAECSVMKTPFYDKEKRIPRKL